jgi:hemolysin activation/secretion protein
MAEKPGRPESMARSAAGSFMKKRPRRLGLCLVIIAAMTASGVAFLPLFAEEPPTFEIRSFIVEGNTLLAEQTIQETLRPYKGPDKTAEDVEKARSALEKVYHDIGYPAVLVNIPEQTTKGGMIRLQVIESKIGNVRVTGNRWFTWESILRDLPSLAPGRVLYLPAVQKDLASVNRGEDLKVTPILSPGKEMGTTDVELKVEDQLPLHGSLEINNRNTPYTSDLRLNATLHYDNLWQLGHSLSTQFQTSPQDTGQVRLYAFSYMLPAPWARDDRIAIYGLRSDTNTTVVGQGLAITGKGEIVGTRYVMPLSPYGVYVHNLTIGVDFKDFDRSTGFIQGEGLRTPVKYLPLLFSYTSSLPDPWGSTAFSSGVNMVFRGLITEESNFAINRYNAQGNYVYLTAGVERNFKLPAGMGAFLKVDGQIADQPLVPNEQYIAGGMTNVRGYEEATALGDNALHGTAEISGPDLGPHLPGDRLRLTPYVFYDFARLAVISPLPSQTDTFRLEGTGVGLKGTYAKNWYYEVDWACPLSPMSVTDRFRQSWYFKVGAQF